MATVHPSRMGLVPQDPKDGRRARSPGYDRDRREKNKGRNRKSDDDSERERGGERERKRDRSNDRRDRQRDRDADRTSPQRADDRGRDRERGRYRERDEDRDRSRRASPEYEDYRRPPSPGPAAPSMYPDHRSRDGAYERRGGYGNTGNNYLESRRAQRENSTFSIWPPSPKAPTRTLSLERGSSRRKSKRDRSETPTESSDSESERRRRERKARKRTRKEKERREREKHPRQSQSGDSEDEERSRERYRNRKSESRSRPRSPSPSRSPSSSRASEDEGEWVEKPAVAAPLAVASQRSNLMAPPATIPPYSKMLIEQDDDDLDDDSDMEIGPQPLMKAIASKKVDERAYGGALLRGEGSAMAAFLKDDTESRIPRRGEIGLTSGEIAQFEAVGYVMSGSRHKRMNAVRMRKENQVISAEEKRGILKLQREERERREAILREEFSELVQEKLKAKGAQTKPTVT